MKKIRLPILILSGFLVGLTAASAVANPDTVYTWIDENGVIHYTNTLPPEGAVIIDTEKELSHDAERARQRDLQQERYLERLRRENRQKAPESRTEPQPEVQASNDKAAEDRSEAETVENDRNRRNETWHQDRIERRQKKKLEQVQPPPSH